MTGRRDFVRDTAVTMSPFAWIARQTDVPTYPVPPVT
jgi:hypothetical protein